MPNVMNILMRLSGQMRMILKVLREWFEQLPDERPTLGWRGMDVKQIARALYGDEVFYGKEKRLLDSSVEVSLYRSLKRMREHGLVVRDPWGGYWLRELLRPEIVRDWITWLGRRHREQLERLKKLEGEIRRYIELAMELAR